MVFGLFMYGFDGNDISVFDETVNFNINTKYDACAYSVLTPYPGNLTRYEMKKANGIVSFDWEKYDQDHVVFRPCSDDRRRASPRPNADLRNVLFAGIDREPVSDSWPTSSYPMADLQHIHAKSITRDHESQQSSAGMVPEQISVADVGPQYVH
jgi:hypothetical protein